MAQGRFVERLRRQHDPNARAHGASTYRLHYILSPGQHHLRLSLRVGRAQPNGRLADPQPYWVQRAHLAQPPPFLAAEDVPLLEALAEHASDGFAVNDGELPASIGAHWLERVCATGRASDGNGRTLEWDNPISAACAWVPDSRGVQHLVWDVAEELWVLPTAPPVYWSSQRRRLGPVACPYPPAGQAWIARAPALEPDTVATFRDNHGRTLQDWGLPWPAMIPLRYAAPAPEPELLLAGAADGAGGDRLYLRFRYSDGHASAVFDYGEAVQQRCIYRHAAGELVALARDTQREATLVAHARATLAPCGAAEAAPAMWSCPDEGHWRRVVLEAVPALQGQGWRLETAPGFSQRFVRADDMTLEASWLERDWFELALHVEVGGERLPLLPLLAQCRQAYSAAALQAAEPDAEYPLDLADGRRLLVPARRLARWLAVIGEADEGAAMEAAVRLPRAQLDRLAQLDDGETRSTGDRDLFERAHAQRASADLRAFVPPTSLHARLRDYQRLGAAWLQQRTRLGSGGVLADDMGLGKTLQVLALIAAEREHGRLTAPVLIVAPTGVLDNWRAEAQRFCPALTVGVVHGSRRDRMWAQLATYDVLITSYNLLARDEARWRDQPLAMVVLDEAQAVRNPRAGISRCVRSLGAPVRFCLTGTPLQNHLGELWALLDFVMPGMLGSERQFNRRYRYPIERDDDRARGDALMERIAPFVLRRRKEEVAPELPDKSEITLRVPLSDEQRALYETLRSEGTAQLQAQREAGEHADPVRTLNLLMRLRQACCDPRLIDANAYAHVEAAKRTYLLSMLGELTDAGRAILVFSQFRSMLESIAADLSGTGISHAMITGATRERGEAIERFQSGGVAVLLMSLKAAGTGLNLTRADTVIHFDPWWNRAAEDQATDRAHRIGQDQPVFVYRLLAADTVEEKVNALQQHKRDLLEQLYNAAESEAARLARDHAELVALLED